MQILKSWTLKGRQLCDIEMIMDGSFAPLNGFMSNEDYLSVIKNMRLSNGELFPIPITLDVSEDFAKKIRIGGLVKENSILKEGKKISFKIHDGIDEILVIYNGILPDLFREEQGVVALGKIENKNFSAIEILAKHDENYMPKEVSDMLKKNGKWKGKLN